MAEKLTRSLLCGAGAAGAASMQDATQTTALASSTRLAATRTRMGRILSLSWAAAAFLLPAVPAAAQSAISKAAPTAVAAPGRLQVAVTYNATLTNPVSGANFWMQGGSVQLEGRFYRGLGAVADIAGAHIANINSTGVGLDLITTVFGPRYTFAPLRRKYSLFVQALGGEAFAFNSLFPAPTGATTSHYGLAVEMGGGLDVNLSPHIALRALQANWLRTQLPNSTNNAQNSLQLGAGIVLRFR